VSRRLEELREIIDEIDEQLIRLLEARMEVCRELGRLKKESGVPIRDRAREESVLSRVPPALRGIFKAIIEECVSIQEKC